jgi:ABC-type multidrug transport system ATPase subunit
MDEFVAQRSAAYISQHDLHIPEMTVRETLAFSARCQGVGTRYGKLKIDHISGNWFTSVMILYCFLIFLMDFL